MPPAPRPTVGHLRRIDQPDPPPALLQEPLREPAGSGRAVVETVIRSLPNAAAVRRHPALHFSDVAAALDKVDGHTRIGRGVQLAILEKRRPVMQARSDFVCVPGA